MKRRLSQWHLLRRFYAWRLRHLAARMDGHYDEAFIDGIRYAAAHVEGTACSPQIPEDS